MMANLDEEELKVLDRIATALERIAVAVEGISENTDSVMGLTQEADGYVRVVVGSNVPG